MIAAIWRSSAGSRVTAWTCASASRYFRKSPSLNGGPWNRPSRHRPSPAAIRKFYHAWLSWSSRKIVHKSGPIVSRQTSNRPPSSPPRHRTSSSPNIPSTACGGRLVSKRARTPVRAEPAASSASREKRTHFIGYLPPIALDQGSRA